MATEAASGIVASHAAAWGAHDERGREALIAHIGGFREPMPGERGPLERIAGFFGRFPPG
jgi:hypothetical protein